MTHSANSGSSTHECQEHALVDDGELGRLAGQRGSAAWPIVDHGHLAEDAVGAHALEHIAECDDVDGPVCTT